MELLSDVNFVYITKDRLGFKICFTKNIRMSMDNYHDVETALDKILRDYLRETLQTKYLLQKHA